MWMILLGAVAALISGLGVTSQMPPKAQAADRFELPMLSTAVSVAEIYEGIVDRDGRSLITTR